MKKSIGIILCIIIAAVALIAVLFGVLSNKNDKEQTGANRQTYHDKADEYTSNDDAFKEAYELESESDYNHTDTNEDVESLKDISEETIEIEKTASILLPGYTSEDVQDAESGWSYVTYLQSDTTMQGNFSVEDEFVPIDEATTIRTFVIPPMPDTTGYVEVTFPFDDMNRIESVYYASNGSTRINAWYGNKKEANATMEAGNTYIDISSFYDIGIFSDYQFHLEAERNDDANRQEENNNMEEYDFSPVGAFTLDTKLYEVNVNGNDCYYRFIAGQMSPSLYLYGVVNCNGRMIEFYVSPNMTLRDAVNNLDEAYENMTNRFKALAGSIKYLEEPTGDEITIHDVPNLASMAN